MSTKNVPVSRQLRTAGALIAEAVDIVRLRNDTNPGVPLDIKQDLRLKPGCVRNGIEYLRKARRLLELTSPPVDLKTHLDASLAEIQRAIDGLHPLSVCFEWLEKGGDPSFRGFWHDGPEYHRILGDIPDEFNDTHFPEHRLIELVEAADRWLCDHGPVLLERRAALDKAASMLEAVRESSAGSVPEGARDAADNRQVVPLPSKQRQVLDILEALPPGEAIPGKTICAKLGDGTEQSTLTRHIIPGLKKAGYPVENRRGAGYYLAH